MTPSFDGKTLDEERGQPNNMNAKKTPFWGGYEFDSRDAVDRFIQDMIRATWTGELGTRQASAINGAIRLLLESRNWLGEHQTPWIPPNRDKVGIVHDEMIRQFLTYDEKLELSEAYRWKQAWDAHSESGEQLAEWLRSLTRDHQEKVGWMLTRLYELVFTAMFRYEEEISERFRKADEKMSERRAEVAALMKENTNNANESQAASKPEHRDDKHARDESLETDP